MRIFYCFIIATLSLFLMLQTAQAGSNATPVNPDRVEAEEVFSPNPRLTLEPVLLTEPLTIDGVIDSAWRNCKCFANFTEFQPAENRRPPVGTSGYLTYDANNLYVAFVCEDPEISQLRASLTDRDKIFNDDWVCISIDPDNDQQKAYEFFINARGIQADQLWQANGNEDVSYDLVWQSEAQIYENYWAAEVRIPFESLRFPNREEQDWSIHLTRHFPRENDYKFSWMPISANNNSYMGQAGRIQFTMPRVQTDSKTLEVLPFAIGTQQSYRNVQGDGTENWQREQLETRAGFGIKYGFSSNLTTDFTYNPDFSQIESDAGQININNPFALFFSEKRPFFQEGSDIYVVDRNSTAGIAIDQFINLFYSRSINDPFYAGKISGRFGRVSVGYTAALDRSTPFIIPFEENTAVLATQERSYSNILRTRYDLGNQSQVGFILTDRRLLDSGSNSVAAVDASIRLSEKYTLTTLAGLTYTREPNDPQLSAGLNGSFEVDNKLKTASFDGESFYGRVLRAKINRDSRHWFATLAYQDFSPGFRADNGFIQSNSFRAAEYVGGYFFRFDDHPILTFIRPRMSVWRKYNYDGVVKDTGLRTSVVISLKNQTTVNASTFIFNRENLYGKQFGDARISWIYFENRALRSLAFNFFISGGRQINRLGMIGDPNNPFELVPSFNIQWGVTLIPSARLTDDLEYQDFKMWKSYGKDLIRGQKILRNTFAYQFSKRMFIRLIGEYNVVDYYSSSASRLVNRKYFTLDPMFSYKLNAFSVFYIGGHIGANNIYSTNINDLRMMNQSFFIKFQYFFRS